uniref:Uncharacterized protein n=1 Tax=Parascaris equorum TaxID=6256 RepID=A0A914RZZ3_PAREQ
MNALILSAKQAVAHAHYARALKYLRKAAEEKPYVNSSAMDMAVIETIELVSSLFLKCNKSVKSEGNVAACRTTWLGAYGGHPS